MASARVTSSAHGRGGSVLTGRAGGAVGPIYEPGGPVRRGRVFWHVKVQAAVNVPSSGLLHNGPA